MNGFKWVTGALVAALALSVYVQAQDAPAEQPEQKAEAEKKERPTRSVRMPNFLPYRDMTSLTDEQKAQINEIHRKYLEERKKLEQAEHAEIQALLTPEQLEEIKQIQEKRDADRKAREEARRQQAKKDSGEATDAPKAE